MNYIEGTGLELQFPTTDVLDKLKTNRKRHAEAYAEAVEGHREAVKKKYKEAIEKYQEELAKLVDGGEVKYFMVEAAPGVSPQHLDEYDTAIEMLEMTSEDTLTLTQTQFHCYVRDKWTWTNNFLGNARYSNTVAMLSAE